MELKNKSKFKETEIGLIPEDWGVDSIGNVSLTITDYVANGSFASLKDNVKYSDTKEYAIMIRFIDFNREFSGNFVYVNKKGYDFLKKTKLFGGEIIISNVGAYAGTVFKVPFIRSPMTLGPNSIMLKTRHNDDFYYYWLKSIYGRDSLQDIKSGSAVPKFNKTDFKKIFVPVPPIKEQEKIAEMLLSLDNEIELNRKINSNLEKIASLLFKQWFVDIGNDLPRGWKIKPLQEVFDFLEGPGIRNWQYSETGTRFINIRLINQGDIDVMSANYINQKDVDEKYQHFLLKKDDLVLSASGTLGRSAIVRKNHLPLLLNTSVIRFRPQDGISYPFMYQYLQSKAFLKEQVSLSSGSVQVNFGPTHLKQMSIVVPDDETLARFNKICESFYKLILFNLDQNNLLQRIRDSLLPRLMSGKIRVNKNYE